MTAKIARDLPARMRERADADQLPPDCDLRRLADALDEAITGYFAEPQTVPVQKFVGAWARARRCWCSHTGEPLI